MNGRVLHFYLAGINNQNFLMRDKETGTWWQQITGKAISGPMKGAALSLVLSDEVTFGEWKSELPSAADGKVLAEVPKYVKEYDSNWEPEVAKYPVPFKVEGTPLKARDVVVGLQIDGPGRAYPWDALVKQSPVEDQVHGVPLLVAVGPDGKSFRVFISRIDGKDAEFFLKGATAVEATAAGAGTETAGTKSAETKTETIKTEGTTAAKPDLSATAPAATTPTAAAAAPAKPWILLDTTTASEWNFQGCATSGPALGKCLDRVPALKDYWFDWRNYHPDTTIYSQ